PKLSRLEAAVDLQGDSAVVKSARFQLNDVPVEAEATVERVQPPRLRCSSRSAARAVGRPGCGPPGRAAPPASRAVAPSGAAARGRAGVAGDGPVAKVSMRSPGGTLHDVPYEGLETDLALAGTVATLERVHVGMLGGTYEGSGRVDVKDAARPRFESRSTIRG